MKGFHNDTHAITSEKGKCVFVREHRDTLRRCKGGEALEQHVDDAYKFLNNGQLPPVWMMSKIEQAYEKTIAALYNVEEAALLKRKWTGFKR